MPGIVEAAGAGAGEASKQAVEGQRAMSAGAIWAIVPVKALSRAKRRLSPTLSAPVRQRLVLAMLEDVLAQLVASGKLDRILVVSPDARVAELARAKGALVLSEDRPRGLNRALKSGLATAPARGP